MTLVSGLAGRHPARHIEAAALAPYPLAADISLNGVWASDASDALTIVDQVYDFETAELTTRLVYQPGDVSAEITVVAFCSRDDPTIVCQELSLRLDGLAKVVLRPMIDARDVEGRALAHERHTPGEAEPACDGSLLWETKGALSTCGLAMVSSVDAPVETQYPPLQRGRLYTEHSFEGDQRREYRLRQIVSVTPNAIHDQPDQHAVRMARCWTACASAAGCPRRSTTPSGRPRSWRATRTWALRPTRCGTCPTAAPCASCVSPTLWAACCCSTPTSLASCG